MKDHMCQHCCGTGEIEREPCQACSGNGWDTHTSSKPLGDPKILAEQAIKKVLS